MTEEFQRDSGEIRRMLDEAGEAMKGKSSRPRCPECHRPLTSRMIGGIIYSEAGKDGIVREKGHAKEIFFCPTCKKEVDFESFFKSLFNQSAPHK